MDKGDLLPASMLATLGLDLLLKGESCWHIRAYISDVQNEACALVGILEGMEILLEEGDRGRNAVITLISVALAKAGEINLALDSVNLPADAVKP